MSETPFTETRRFKVMRTVIGAMNPVIKRILPSRLGRRMNQALLLLRFRGRNSGRWYSTPVGYVRAGDRCIVVTSRTYEWWKNVRDGADVEVLVEGQWYAAHARVVPPHDADYDEILAQQVAGRGPDMLRGFGVPVDDEGRIAEADRDGADAQALVVDIQLRTPIEAPSA